MPLYQERDVIKLDAMGDYCLKHMDAMTRENLHMKADIAAELGHRDYVIHELAEALKAMQEMHCRMMAEAGDDDSNYSNTTAKAMNKAPLYARVALQLAEPNNETKHAE